MNSIQCDCLKYFRIKILWFHLFLDWEFNSVLLGLFRFYSKFRVTWGGNIRFEDSEEIFDTLKAIVDFIVVESSVFLLDIEKFFLHFLAAFPCCYGGIVVIWYRTSLPLRPLHKLW